MAVRLHSSWKKENTKEKKETKQIISLKKLLTDQLLPPHTNAQTQWIKFHSDYTIIFIYFRYKLNLKFFIDFRYIFNCDYLYFHSLCTLHTHPGQVKQINLGLEYENIENHFLQLFLDFYRGTITVLFFISFVNSINLVN